MSIGTQTPASGSSRSGRHQGDRRERIKQQLGTAFPGLKGVDILFDEPAERDRRHLFPRPRRPPRPASGRHPPDAESGSKPPSTRCGPRSSRSATARVRRRRGPLDFPIRPEQQEAVDADRRILPANTRPRIRTRAPHFLWNAKMRFGKTFTTYKLAREMGWNESSSSPTSPRFSLRGETTSRATSTSRVGTSSTATPPSPRRRRPRRRQRPTRLVRLVPGPRRARPPTGDQGSQRDHPLHRLGLHRHRRVPLRCLADSRARPLRPHGKPLAEEEEPDEQVTEEDLGLKADHYLYLSGTPFRAITNGEFTEDADLQLDLHRRAGGEGRLGSAPTARTRTSTSRDGDVHLRIGDGGGRTGLTTASSTAFSLNEYFRAKQGRREQPRHAPAPTFSRTRPASRSSSSMLRGKLSDQLKTQVLDRQKPPFPYESPVFQRRSEALGLVHGRRRRVLCDAGPAR